MICGLRAYFRQSRLRDKEMGHCRVRAAMAIFGASSSDQCPPFIISGRIPKMCKADDLDFVRESRIRTRSVIVRVDHNKFPYYVTHNSRCTCEAKSRNRKMSRGISRRSLVCFLTKKTLRNTQLQLKVVLRSSLTLFD
jgi:hypothetical protein